MPYAVYIRRQEEGPPTRREDLVARLAAAHSIQGDEALIEDVGAYARDLRASDKERGTALLALATASSLLSRYGEEELRAWSEESLRLALEHSGHATRALADQVLEAVRTDLPRVRVSMGRLLELCCKP